MSSFTDQVKPLVERTVQKSVRHPFITGLQDGSVPQDTFAFYLIQDAKYLQAFADLHEQIAKQLPAKAGHLLRSFVEADNPSIQSRQKINQELGLTAEDFARTPSAPANYAYVSHMYYQFLTHGPAVGCAALLPCYWVYDGVGRELAASKSPVPVYQAYFDEYSAAVFHSSTESMKQIVDQEAAEVDADQRAQMRRAFEIGCYYELRFWQMALSKEQW